MSKIILTRTEAEQVIDEGVKGDFEKHHRHNGGYQDIIFLRDGKYYLLTYLWFEDDGIYWDETYEAQEVIEAERVEKYWKTVD
jgi:hypothetical protein